MKRLRKLGLRKVMVTNMHPLGCTPLFARGLNYTDCLIKANLGSRNHNQALRAMINKLDPANQSFLTLNLNEPFQDIVYQGLALFVYAFSFLILCDVFISVIYLSSFVHEL